MAVSVADYYKGKSVFITGATGFIGKVLLEKLLRSCPDIHTIYCLVRPKKGQPGCERLKNVFEDTAFDGLKEMKPNFMEKVVSIHGDVLQPGLGIKPEDLSLLQEKVNVIFHSAAVTNFNEKIRLAAEMNVGGTLKVIRLAKQLKHLEILVHVSTAYANCNRTDIEEVIYPSPTEPQKLLAALEWMNDEMLDKVTPEIIGPMPNTYTYTKQLAENLLVTEGAGLTMAVVRPSIVTGSWQEPIPGWVDNMNGPSGLYVAAGKGLLRTMVGDSNGVADLIPVDLTTNMVISVPWYTAVKKPQELMVYNITTGTLNPHTWGEMETVGMAFFKQNPMEKCFRRPQTRILTKSNIVNDYWMFFSHLIPAYLVDFGSMLAGQKPRMVSTYNKLHRALSVMEYFTIREWNWSHNNLDVLKAAMSPEDQKKFQFDPRVIHWNTYIHNYCMGTKKYILGEKPSGLPAARAHIRKLRNIRYICNTIMLISLWRALIPRLSIARNSWYLIMSLVSKFVRFFSLSATMARS